MQNYRTKIISNQEISPGYFRMRILAPGFGEDAHPGQFVMFRVQRSLPPLLRRPFGIFRTGYMDADCEGMPPKEFVEIVYKVVGRGTSIMAELHEGDKVELLGPLGNGFDSTRLEGEKILVGGGIGLVPLYMLAGELIEKGCSVRLLMGGRTRDDILAVTEFERLGVETYVSTDDGSLGEEGLITEVLKRKLKKYPDAQVFACGPMPMLCAVNQICVEESMACGVGACLGCVVKGAGHTDESPSYLCSCKVGPVFKAQYLDWTAFEEKIECGGCA